METNRLAGALEELFAGSEGDSVVVTGWVRTTREGRLADTQARWVYRFNDDDQVVSARVERV